MRELGRLLRLIKPYRRSAWFALLGLTINVVLELTIPRLIQRIVDQGIPQHDRSLVVQTTLVMLAISVVSTVVAITNNVTSVRVGEGVARDLREMLFRRIQGFSFGNLDRHHVAPLLVRLTSDVSAAKNLVQISLRIGTRAPLMMLGSLALMVRTSPGLALKVLPLLAVTAFLIAFFVLRTEPLYRAVQEKLDALTMVLQENVAFVRLVKSLVRAEFEGARFEAVNEAMTERSIKVMQIMSLMSPLLAMCINTGVVVVLCVGGLQSIRGELSLGQIIAFTNYLVMTMAPLVMMTMLSSVWAAGIASSRRTAEILETVPDVRDLAEAQPLVSRGAPRISFENVSFTYHGEGQEAALRGVTFTAEPGEVVAIVGSTGAGKSTLVSLVPRFYDVSAGRVLIDGRDVRGWTLDSLAPVIGVVPQETLLFSGTVRDNIRYGRPDASDEDVVRAATAAEVHAFVSRLPAAYDTFVTPRGTNFSGGQKQRIALARALLLEPKILILDDAMSAVDTETESKIRRSLTATQAGRTTLLVAQRIDRIASADRIVVLERGCLMAQGTHRELLASCQVYREICDSQDALASGVGG